MPRWQLLNPDGVIATPTTGLLSRPGEIPIERAKDRRRYRAKSRSAVIGQAAIEAVRFVAHLFLPFRALGPRYRKWNAIHATASITAARASQRTAIRAGGCHRATRRQRITKGFSGAFRLVEIQTLLVSRYSRIDSIPLSRPMPERFMPPNGIM